MKAALVPDRTDLKKAYVLLQSGGPDGRLVAGQLVTWAEWARLDARLAELFVLFVSSHFTAINPFELWRLNKTSDIPQALAFLLDVARFEVDSCGDRRQVGDYDAWFKSATHGLEPCSSRFFFIREGSASPIRDLDEIRRSLRVYRRWGFFGNDAIVSRKRTERREGSSTLVGKAEREHILEELLAGSSVISVDDYMKACGDRIHRRTAERDLARCPRVRASGETRRRKYHRV